MDLALGWAAAASVGFMDSGGSEIRGNDSTREAVSLRLGSGAYFDLFRAMYRSLLEVLARRNTTVDVENSLLGP